MWCSPIRRRLRSRLRDAANPPQSYLKDGVFSVASSSDEEEDKRRDGQPGQGEVVAPDFLQLSHFIFDQFSDAKGETVNRRRSAGPAEENFVMTKPSGSFVPFKWSRPMSEALDFTYELLTDKVGKGSQPSSPTRLDARDASMK